MMTGPTTVSAATGQAEATRSGSGSGTRSGSAVGKQRQKRAVIGAASRPVNYSPREQVFEEADLLPGRETRKAAVVELKRSNILDTQRPGWNTSTDTGEKICERKHMQNFVRDRSRAYQYNYRSEVLPRNTRPGTPPGGKFTVTMQTSEYREVDEETRVLDEGKFKQVEEYPSHPSLRGAKPWNSSTEVTVQQRRDMAQTLDEQARTNSRRRSDALAKTGTYQSAPARTRELRRTHRKLKKEGMETSQLPTALRRAQTANVEAQLPENRGNRFAIEPKRRFRTYSHSGVWEYNEHEGCHMWSDTGSFEREGPGDIVRVTNPDAYNFASPTMH